jgi:DNA-binding response OmpR family regulator
MGTKFKILVVDDDVAVNEVICDTLKSQGYEVVGAFDGERGLELVASFQPAIVLLDVVMPKENGYRVSRQIKSAETGIVPKVLILTGRRLSEFPDREKMFREFSMADDVIYKPIEVTKLLEAVSSLLGAKPAQPVLN